MKPPEIGRSEIAARLRIRPLQADDIEAAKQVMCEAICDVLLEQSTPLEIRAQFDQSGEMHDIDQAATHYFARRGCFLVLLDGERVVGMGGVRRLDDQTCELKRMWFLRPYRGLGWGRRMAQQLIDWSRDAGYKTMRLDSGGSGQAPAIALYRKLGFEEIPPYNDNTYARIWMEKQL